LRALWPVLRLLGIVATIVGEVFSRVAAAVAQAIGGLVKAIGNMIAHIPGLGGVGHAIANFGQSILNFGQGARQAADEFARTRKELQGMTWDQTAQALEDLQNSAQNASDALNNIPSGFRIQRAIFLASPAINGPQSVTGASGGQTNYFAPGSIVINTQRQRGDELLDEVSRAARDRNMARRGTTAGAADVIG
jgi:phage-related protein